MNLLDYICRFIITDEICLSSPFRNNTKFKTMEKVTYTSKKLFSNLLKSILDMIKRTVLKDGIVIRISEIETKTRTAFYYNDSHFNKSKLKSLDNFW